MTQYTGDGAKKLANVGLQKQQTTQKIPNEILELQKQVAHLERLISESIDEEIRLQAHLEDEQDRGATLSQELDELHTFLSDYDLHWVGGPPPINTDFPKGPLDMKLFMQQINKLNSSVAPKKVIVKDSDNQAKLGFEKPLLIDLYEEGFTVEEGDLRPYHLKLSGAFFKDIYDGYFPIEFKETYPDGVTLKVIDHRNESEEETLFKGHGRHLIESARREKREQLPQPKSPKTEEIGFGDGQIRLRFATGKTKIIKVTPNLKIMELRQIIKETFAIDSFTLQAIMSPDCLDENKTIQELQLYPKGVIVLTQTLPDE